MSVIADIIKSHLLLFERPLQPLPTKRARVRFVWSFLLCGVLLLWVVRQLIPLLLSEILLTSRFIFAVVLVIGSLLIVKVLVGQDWSYIGLRSWSRWTRREKLYAIQVIPAASLVFYFLFQNTIADMIFENGVVGFVVVNLLFGLLWGFFQEFAYRGVLQTALSSFLGPFAGIIGANLIFTFGPLHLSVYAGLSADLAGVMQFLPIFIIGLLFGIIYQRSGNLWLPAIFHGLWPLNMVG